MLHQLLPLPRVWQPGAGRLRGRHHHPLGRGERDRAPDLPRPHQWRHVHRPRARTQSQYFCVRSKCNKCNWIKAICNLHGNPSNSSDTTYKYFLMRSQTLFSSKHFQACDNVAYLWDMRTGDYVQYFEVILHLFSITWSHVCIRVIRQI